MSALIGLSHRVGIIGTHASPQPANALVRSCATAAGILAMLALLLAGQACAAQQKPAPASTAFQQAEELIQQGRLAEAKTATLDEIARHPSSVEGYNLLGIIQGDQQDYSGAVESLQKALKLAPSSVKTHNNLGNIYVALKKLDLAEKEFRTVLRLDPANRDANYNLGVLLMMKNAPAEAIPHLQRVRPANVATQFNLVRAYFQARRAPEALKLATELSAQNASSVQLHFSLGVMLASEKQYQAAQLELEKADALEPGTFEILYNLGQTYLRGAQFPKADLVLNRALTLKPDSADTMVLLAQAYTNESRPLDALDVLIRAHKLAPENADVIFLMAQVSMSQNYYEDAIPLLESGLKIAPRRTDLMAALGESYFMAGRADQAIAEFKQLVAIENSARSYAFLGLSYRNLGRFDEAKEAFDQGLKLDPHNVSCLYNLGFIAERQGDAATAEKLFQQALQSNPNFADALLEMANLRIAAKNYPDAETYLRRFVRVSRDPSTGYYKLAMVERSLHETAAADRDLDVFKTLSKSASSGPYPYQHLFDYLDNRANLAPQARQELDITELSDQVKKHPDQPQNLYMLAEAYLKAGNIEDARSTIEQLDKISAGDYRTLTGNGVLLARYHLYNDAVQHFQQALQVNPNSDEVRFDLANAYFRERLYTQALDAAQQISEQGRKDDSTMALIGDIYSHLGDTAHAKEIFRDAITRNPDNDQYYLSLALIQMREGDTAAGKATLLKGQARIPGSGKLFWGLGLASALEGNTARAAADLERAVDLLPEWSGGYSTLGVFYYQTGQIAKAREVLDRFKTSSVSSSLDIDRIEQVLNQASANPEIHNQPMTTASKEQLLQLAISLADRTL